MEGNKGKNLIVELTFNFALNIIKYAELLESQRKFIIARQLLKSGTLIGANVREAQNGESRADFIHKLKISAKEADETSYWLELCKNAENYPTSDELTNDFNNIIRILAKIIASSKKNIIRST